VEVAVHSYRHRCGAAPGDPDLEDIERRLAATPPISVPTISLCGQDDGVHPPAAIDGAARRFTGPYERRLLPGIGHDVPQEAPRATIEALLALLAPAAG
jgi:pimeloyl-ACP methyl ester carboxylesterase